MRLNRIPGDLKEEVLFALSELEHHESAHDAAAASARESAGGVAALSLSARRKVTVPAGSAEGLDGAGKGEATGNFGEGLSPARCRRLCAT